MLLQAVVACGDGSSQKEGGFNCLQRLEPAKNIQHQFDQISRKDVLSKLSAGRHNRYVEVLGTCQQYLEDFGAESCEVVTGEGSPKQKHRINGEAIQASCEQLELDLNSADQIQPTGVQLSEYSCAFKGCYWPEWQVAEN